MVFDVRKYIPKTAIGEKPRCKECEHFSLYPVHTECLSIMTDTSYEITWKNTYAHKDNPKEFDTFGKRNVGKCLCETSEYCGMNRIPRKKCDKYEPRTEKAIETYDLKGQIPELIYKSLMKDKER